MAASAKVVKTFEFDEMSFAIVIELIAGLTT